MAQIINTNIASLNAQRNLTTSQSSLATSLERLSSGLRINSAKDDAAGLAIAERFTTQIRGLNQAVRNANDGISFAQTAEGALASVSDNLQRIRELAVQSANDTNSPADRQSLNNEVQQLIAEVSRVANATEFNGGRVLDGSVSNLFFQVGANQGQTIAVSGVDARASELGSSEITSAPTGALSQAQIATGLTFDGVQGITVGATSIAITADLNGVTSFENAVREINVAIQSAADTDTTGEVADAQLKAALRVDNNGNTSIVINGAFGAVFDVDAGGTVEVTGGGDVAAVAAAPLFAAGAAVDVAVNTIDVSTRNASFQSIAAIDGALNQINGLRADLGSVQVRFEATITNLSISTENLSASRSRIQDADFAAETANLTRASILQQAGTAILAQANALPQNVLSLLG